MRRLGVVLAIAGGTAIVAGLVLRREPRAPGSPPQKPKLEGGFPVPIAVGRPDDPGVAPLLAEMGEFFADAGVDLDTVSPREVTERASDLVAIPPRSYWPRMARTLVEVYAPIREALGVPLVVRNGYRSPEHNAKVGGAENSRHQAFEALDLSIAKPNNTANRRRQLAEAAVGIYKSRGSALKMGLGIYGSPTPNSIHVDTGHQRRVWAKTREYL